MNPKWQYFHMGFVCPTYDIAVWVSLKTGIKISIFCLLNAKKTETGPHMSKVTPHTFNIIHLVGHAHQNSAVHYHFQTVEI